MENYKSRIGKSQMRQYMGDLYENPMVVYREYIQNACDAIEDALSEGLILDRKKTTIIVKIDTFNKNIIFEDKGIGIKREQIAPYLVDIASSKKVGRAGQYGIGRLNGANYCDRIVYETSAFGEDIKSTLVWDVKKAREICDDAKLNPTTEEIIDDVTYLLPKIPENIPEHYCRVTLENINNDLLLDQNKVIQYISQIVPVDYSLEFKDNLLKPSLDIDNNQCFKQRFNSLWIYKISVNDIPVEKQYTSEIESFRFGSLTCFSLKDNKTLEEYAWGWYALNMEAKQMNDLPISFIRARHRNYQIGPNTLLSGLYPTPVSQSYFIGELHLVHPNLMPTASRDGIKQNETKIIFESIIRKFFKDLNVLYNKASKFRSEVVDIVAEKNIQIATLTQKLKVEEEEEMRKQIKASIKDAKEKKNNAETRSKNYEEFFNTTNSWNIAEDIVSSVNLSKIKLHNQKSEVVKEDLQIPYLKLESFKTKEPNKENYIIKPQFTPQGNEHVDLNPTPKAIKPESELDVYKGLGKVEQGLIKKFYKVINQVDLPEKTKAKIKNSLKKKILK